MITASMATIGRKSLPLAVESIINQVDRLEIKYNGCEPLKFNHPKIYEFAFPMNLGDGVKFNINIQGDYHLTIDDDLIYPKNYVKTYVEWIDRLGVVSSHGVRFSGRTESYYKGSNRTKFHCLFNCDDVERVHVVGTGVLGFSRKIRPELAWCKAPNMADIWFSLACETMGIPRYVIPHREGWIEHAPIDFNETIYKQHKDDDKLQTKIANQIYDYSCIHSTLEATRDSSNF